MFTGGTIWLLTHGHMSVPANVRRPATAHESCQRKDIIFAGDAEMNIAEFLEELLGAPLFFSSSRLQGLGSELESPFL